jgi:serine/threonine-protein kinase
MMPVLPMVGDEFAGYRLRAVIGRGGMSVVYQAENPRLGSVVALKVLAPELATDDVFRTRFLEESRIAASLNHPNVVPIFDMGPCNDLLYIAMRYVAGVDLRALLKKRGRIPPGDAVFLTGQAARALDAAHRRGLVHRDVKPGNLLIERGGDDDPDHVYLADFGITKHVTSRSGLTSTGQFLGTIDYIAPEQIQGRPVDGRADQYSLGCVLYECLTGHVPFEKDLDAAIIWAHVEEMPPMPSRLSPELPAGVDEVFSRVLAKEAADRYPGCREFVEAARGSLGGTAAEPQPVRGRQDAAVSTANPEPDGARQGMISQPGEVSTPRPAGEPGGGEQPPTRRATRLHRLRRRRVLAALAVLVLIIAAGIGAWVVSGGGSGSHRHNAAGSSMPAAPHSQLYNALVAANKSQTNAKGELPPSTCHQQSASAVSCSNPVTDINEVSFRVYPSLSALYKAYEAKVKTLASGHFKVNFRNCDLRNISGEVSWNHAYLHPKKWSVADLATGHLNPETQAEGRVYCNLVNNQEYYVWTQNDGRLLGSVSGGDHQAVWNWWMNVHHNISFGNMPGMKGM